MFYSYVIVLQFKNIYLSFYLWFYLMFNVVLKTKNTFLCALIELLMCFLSHFLNKLFFKLNCAQGFLCLMLYLIQYKLAYYSTINTSEI